MMRTKKVVLLGLIICALLIPSKVYGECTCDGGEEEGRDKNLALKYKLVAIASILVAGAIGVAIPILGEKASALSSEGTLFFIIKAFAAGVILATGFIHVLPDAFKSLTSPCLSEHPWGDFPFTGFVAMVSAIGILMVETFATSYFNKRSTDIKIDGGVSTIENGGVEEGVVSVHTHAVHGHAHGYVNVVDHMDSSSSQIHRRRVIALVLELGMVVHSVIIGIAIGTSEVPKTIKPLMVALTFHQFFEGMGLGGCIAQTKQKSVWMTFMGLLFAVTTPAGIVIGILITNVYDENSPKALIVEGIFNAASAGILIYMALVDILAEDFKDKRMQNNSKLQFGANSSLLLGAGLMSLLAKWA